MSNERKMELLTQPQWDYHCISEYVGCGSTKAIEIKNAAIKNHDGAIRYLNNCVKVDSVMKVLGTTREREIELLKKVIGKEEENVRDN